MRQQARLEALILAAIAAIGPFLYRAQAAEPTPPIDYHREVWPVIKTKCLECHNPKKRQGALDMSTLATMLAGGHSGPALVPGNVEKSLLLELIEFDEMPPRKTKKPRVTKAELEKLKAWIAAGAEVPQQPKSPDECE